jgi:hypothetical protein
MLEEHMKNKIAAVLFAGLLALGAVACSSDGDSGDTGGDTGVIGSEAPAS